MKGQPLLPERPETWPDELREALTHARQWSEPWFNGHPERRGAYDRLHDFLTPELQDYALRGWHCCRLRDAEADEIRTEGLQVLSEDLLLRRIDAANGAQDLSDDLANRLRIEHQARNMSRSGQLWFGFSPELPSEHAIAPLLRYWGGEAIYWAHIDEEGAAAELSSIGRPTLIDVWVPVCGMRTPLELVDVLCRADLRSIGQLASGEVGTFETYSTIAVPAANIIGIEQYPAPSFLQRTRCTDWEHLL